MFTKWWHRWQERRALQVQKDAVEIANAGREAEHDELQADLSDAEKMQPIFRPTDWTGVGPT